ncbi:MAG: LysR family transcriptional regulator [Actinobacteria bacterium 13_2_20CM_2_71_6]|nr:MAG: LysR family transcriptional regulator [Actinobacteria bacterium 13_2_20CM_2_71_6]
MDVHLRDLRYFVAVADELSFTRAAERLYVSQPALSKQIRQLEQAMRATLLRRDPRGVTLTAAGALLLPSARRLLETWDDTARAVLAAEAHDRRVLRLGMQTSIGRNLYPAVLRRFAELKPDWRLTLRLCEWTDPSAGLLDESSDAAFVWLPLPVGLEYRVLLNESRWVALPMDHPLAGRTEIDLADLLDEPFVALPEQAGPMRDFWLATDERQGRPARIGVEVSTPDETFEAIASGLGIHLLAAGNADIYARPGITRRPVRGLSPCQLAVAWRHGDARAQVKAFVSACEDAATLTGTPDPVPG